MEPASWLVAILIGEVHAVNCYPPALGGVFDYWAGLPRKDSVCEPTTSPQIIYHAPEPIVLDNFARAVCQQVADQGQPEFRQHEIWQGLAQFLKVVTQMHVKQLNKNEAIYKGKAHVTTQA